MIKLRRAYFYQTMTDGRSAETYTDFIVRDFRRRIYAISIAGKYGHILDAKAILTSRNTQLLKRSFVSVSDLYYADNIIRSTEGIRHYLLESGYRVAVSRLDDHAQLIAISKHAFGQEPPFLLIGPKGSLLSTLERHLREKSAVPFLPEWLPWIIQHLYLQRKLKNLFVETVDYLQDKYDAWLLMATDDDIQNIISEGLRSGHISIGQPDQNAKPLTDIARSSLTEYVRTFKEELANIITQKYKPLFDPLNDSHTWDESSIKRKLLRAQADAVQGVLEIWKRDNWAIICGEMGVGKGVIGPVIPYVHSNGKPFRTLVVCPGHLVEKWKREIEATIPDAHVEIIRSWGDIRHRDPKERPTKPEYLIVSRSRAKLHYLEKPGTIKRVRNGKVVSHRCPKCAHFMPINWDFNTKTERNSKCPHCNEKLWQADKDRVRRYSMAKWISKRMKGWIDYLIIDEIHEDKGGDSAQGEAMGQLVGAAKYVLGLTGTLLGGYADDLYYLLFRLDPKAMKRLGFEYGSVHTFNQRYGTVQQIRKRQRGSQRAGQIQYRRLPGVSPMIFPQFLMDNVVFLELSDLGYELPEYKEYVHMVDMDEELEEAYREVEEFVRSKISTVNRTHMAGYLNAVLAYPDHPYLNRPIVRRTEQGEVRTYFEPRVLDEGVVRNKEQELIWICQAEKEQGRRCYVYVNFTGDFNAHERLATLLRNAGLRVAVLTADTVPQEKREAWLSEQVANGVDVVISHPRLVQTGLDLYDYPTIIVYQAGMSIYTLRQAVRRSWRIGQTKPVRVYFLCYRNTLQEDLLRLMGAKLEAATTIEGKFSEEGLRAIADTEDMTSALARALIEGLDGVDSAEAIWSRVGASTKSRHSGLFQRSIKPIYTVRTVGEMIEMGVKKRTKYTLDNQLAFDFAS